MNAAEEAHRDLVRGLVGARYAHLFTTSAAFHAAVEGLARMLPAWVEGLAKLAEEEDANLVRARLLMGSGIPVTARDVETPLSDLLSDWLSPERDR